MSAFHPKLHAGGPSGGSGPSLSQWTGASSSLSASIVLDQDPNQHPTPHPHQVQAAATTTAAYTNLDVLSGRVLVRTAKSADISSIVVKLEGESRSRLMTPPGLNGERSRAVVEYHKILYKTQTVFPPSSITQQPPSAGPSSFPSSSSSRPSYTLPIGQHAYPFSFKLPFNNQCTAHQNANVPVMVGMEVAMPASQHVKRTLPPTLSGFPGEAEIRYFVKVTVVRQSLFKENPRAYAPFNFFPIEPPRPRDSGSETYARQRHAFTPMPGGPEVVGSRGKMKSLFGQGEAKAQSPTTAESSNTAPAISVDARLPEPAILTCSQAIPLRIIVKRSNASTDPIYLTSLQISLIGHTKIRAHEVFRTESQSWIVMSQSHLDLSLLGAESGGEGEEVVVDDELWKGCVLPNTVAPGFVTCNVQREYQLDVRVGLAYRGGSGSDKPQPIILPLRLDTQIFSGIAPPPEVLARMAATSSSTKTTHNYPLAAKFPAARGRPDPEFGANTVPYVSGEEGMGEAPPPSYEDAMAEDSAAPGRGTRPVYDVPIAEEDRGLGVGDEKKGWR